MAGGGGQRKTEEYCLSDHSGWEFKYPLKFEHAAEKLTPSLKD